MNLQQQMNFIDVMIILIYIAMVFKGAYTGFIAQMSAFVGALLGIVIASQTYYFMAQKIQVYFDSFTTACVIGYVLTIFFVFSICIMLAKYIKKMFMIKMAPWLDHLIGGVLGFFLATFITLFSVYMGLKVQDLQLPIQNSILVPYVNNVPDSFKALLPLNSTTI
ncbi:MAG: CvpA family protein [Desulfovibrionaceae bacterium]|nr:CvpA family protein [Desulfovibrionaceae bacterium]